MATPTRPSKYYIKDVKALYRFCIVRKYKVNSNKFNGIAQLTVRVHDRKELCAEFLNKLGGQ